MENILLIFYTDSSDVDGSNIVRKTRERASEGSNNAEREREK
jgi:hypothetical protein